MLGMLRRLLGFQLTVAEWIGIALILGAPYLLIGVVWTATHTDRLGDLAGVELVVSFLGSIALWPALLAAHVCMP